MMLTSSQTLTSPMSSTYANATVYTIIDIINICNISGMTIVADIRSMKLRFLNLNMHLC